MPEVLVIRSVDWELSVWTRDQSSRQRMFAETMVSRGGAGTASTKTEIRLFPPLQVTHIEVNEKPFLADSDTQGVVALSEPLFFENTLYEFEFVFTDAVSGKPAIQHKLLRIHNAFRYTTKHGVKSLRGNVNPGNDVGWLRLPLFYEVAGVNRRAAVSVEVFPTKMDMVSDLQTIYKTVDSQYPLWRFALAEQTEQEFDRTRDRNQSFPLLWLAQFESIQSELAEGVDRIIRSPHSRLIVENRWVTADRLRGKIPNRLGEQVRSDLAGGMSRRRYLFSRKKLSVDTPENRFVKLVLEKSRDNLASFLRVAHLANSTPDKNRLSPFFFQTLNGWRKNIEKQLANPLFDEVGQSTGMLSDSLVLQQKSGYSAVYRCWQKLKMYLGVLGRQASVSMKSVAELYEVWCFLELRDVLLSLGFAETKQKKGALRDKGLERTIHDGFFGAFEFQRQDGVKVRLVHEPLFSSTTGPIKALLTAQKPDIVLEARFASGESFIWLFDAKYRIRDDGRTGDYVPDDAINQMHRYRDALIHSHSNSEKEERSRPVFGAFVLYPGYFNQQPDNIGSNPYISAIREVGIGAFPLVPSQTKDAHEAGSAWLKAFIGERLGGFSYAGIASPERLYIEDSARIPVSGMTQLRYPDLTMVVTAAPRSGRNPQYVESFRNGTAAWYHMKFYASERENIQKHLMREIRHCVIASYDPYEKTKSAEYVWSVDQVTLVPRSNLTVEQTGSTGNGDGLYWLFKLSASRKLARPIAQFPPRGHHLKLCSLADADDIELFRDIKGVYSSVDVVNKVLE